MLFLTAVGTLVLTIIHHGYGAFIYASPFRLHVVFWAIPVMIIVIFAYRFSHKLQDSLYGKVAYWIWVGLSMLVSSGVIGLYEGGYNHLLKNLFYFGGASEETLNSLFPPPLYEMPNNVWFEASGILQFLTGMLGIYYGFKLWKKPKRSTPHSQVTEQASSV